MKFLLSDDDIWNVTADAIVVPADCSMGIDLSLLTRAGPTFCAHYEQMIQQQRMKFPLTEPTVQQLQPGNILRCKGLFLLFPGSKKGKKATELDGFNVTEAYKLLMNQITKLEYNSMAIMLSSTDSKSSVSEMLFCVSSIASKKVGFGEITLFSKSKPVMKTTCFLLGGKCLDLSTPEKTNVFIKSLTSSAIIKSSMKMVLKTAQGKSPCYFAIARTNLKKAAGYILQCSGEHIKMSEVKADVELFGADHVLDLLILRGSGEQINWKQESEKIRINESVVCKTHLQKLLLNWKSDKVFNRKNALGRPMCRVPNAIHDGFLNVQKQKLTKKETVRLMNATGVLCHVGAAICINHMKALEENRFEYFKFDDKFYDATMKSSEDESSYAPTSRESSVVEDHQITEKDKAQEELDRKVQEIAHLLGLSRVSSQMNWNDLQPAVKDKKVNAMVQLIDGVCRVAAGEDWEEFRNRCISKMGCVGQDNRVSEIMSTISTSLEHCPIRSVRNRILSLVTGIFSERVIIQYTGCTSYDIRQAKLSAKDGFKEAKQIFRRDKGGRAMLLEFIKFLALPDVTMCMPSPGKVYVLESGEQVELAKVVRTYSYHEIFRMFLRYSEKKAIDDGKATAADVHEFVKTNCLGFSTAYKIMEVVVPVRRKRLQCIDNFQADSIEAFEYLNEYANELATMGVINAVTKSDLLRRSRVSSNFISYDQRVHMERFSDTINHCLCYLLSDPKKKEFATACNLGINGHSHDNVCSDCLECTDVFDVILEILRKTHAEYVDKEFPERIRISRMIEQMKLSKHDVLEYRKHQIRAFSSDMDRKDIVENLQPKEALIVLDFSLKLIPTGSVEKQSEWFGKAGISYHMTYCVANLDGSLYHHSFGHSADDLKQDSIAVSAITKHALLQLKENGVEKVYIRSDNAGTYHNAAYLATLFHLEKLTGVQILAYVFSEAQAGKGDADREISHSKRKIRDGVDSKKNATNANEVIEVLTTGTLLKASSFHEIELTEKSVSKSSFPGISSYGSLQFEPTGIRARKFDKIGEGIFLEEKKIISNEYDFEVLSEGGHLSQSAGFWKKFDDDEDKEVEPDHDVDVDDDSIEPAKEGIFSCPDRLCISRFLTVNGLAKHKLRQVHRTRKNSESTIDAGVRMFASAIETDTAAARSVKSDTLVSIKASHGKLPGKGWAMKSQQRAPPMDDEMKEVITKYFHERRGEGRRALAREIYAKVREMKNGKTGEYLFPLKDCPKESQCQSLISSLLRLESAAASLKNKAHKRSKLMDGADESDESSDDNRPSCSTSKDSDQKARKRKVSGKKSSLLRKEKTPIFEDDEFADTNLLTSWRNSTIISIRFSKSEYSLPVYAITSE